MKECRICKLIKNENEFVARGFDTRNECKECSRSLNKTRYEIRKSTVKQVTKSKTCTKCKSIKDVSKFRKNQNSKDGFDFSCKTCMSEYYQSNVMREYLIKKKQSGRQKEILDKYRNKESVKSRFYSPSSTTARKDYRINNWKSQLLDGARSRAKKLNIEFSINEKDIIDPRGKLCPGFKTEFILADKPCNESATLDRIDNSKGYIPGNVWVVSKLLNQIKSVCTLEEIRKIGNAVLDKESSEFVVVVNKSEETKSLRKKMVRGKKSSNKQSHNLEFSIEWFNISLPEFCPCTGEKIDYSNESKDWRLRPSIDRIDNSKGYIPGNVWVISGLANTVKANANGKQILLVADTLEAKVLNQI